MIHLRFYSVFVFLFRVQMPAFLLFYDVYPTGLGQRSESWAVIIALEYPVTYSWR